MNQINFDTFYNSTATSFNIYRSVPGFVLAYPNGLQVGDTITFCATSPVQQSITFTAVDKASVVSQFNAQAKGAFAALSSDGASVIFRVVARCNPKFRLYPCTFATDVGQTPRTIVPGLEWAVIGTVTPVSGTYSYSASDVDGTQYDMYKVTSVVGSTESLPSLAQLPQLGTAELCAVEGRIADSQNRPVVGLKVRAEIRIPMASTCEHGIDGDQREVFTDAYGRFTIYLSQCRIYLFQIPAIGYNQTVQIPDAASVNFLDLCPTTKAQFSPFGDPQ